MNKLHPVEELPLSPDYEESSSSMSITVCVASWVKSLSTANRRGMWLGQTTATTGQSNQQLALTHSSPGKSYGSFTGQTISLSFRSERVS